MLFNSTTFLVFFVIVYSAYLAASRSHKIQNLLILAASYFFYGSWDWRFLSLLLLSTTIDYFVGRALRSPNFVDNQKALVFVSVASNLSILGFFKYFNFFVDSFSNLLSAFGMSPDAPTLNIILPVGISFYTFQSLSYTIDIYRRRLEPTPNFLDFALFVSFFPQLVAGPIERARHLLPQIAKPRTITWSMIDAGTWLILWGYFKKVVIADNIGAVSDEVFVGFSELYGIDILIGVLAFSIQIYCDFSGYSDIARGICKLMGFDLMINFRLPYLASNPSDFWRRWHISLSTWLRDYLYIPLGGSHAGEIKTYRNLFVTMLLGGLWHGAAWTFVIWGAYHGSLLIAYRWASHRFKWQPNDLAQSIDWLRPLKILLMFGFTLVGWLIFRAESPYQIAYMLQNVFSISESFSKINAYNLLFFSSPLIAVQYWQSRAGDLLIVTKQNAAVRGIIYGGMIYIIGVFGVRESAEFIYFQF